VAVARERMVVALPIERAMDLWTDPRRWSTWVDGFGRLVEEPQDWPEPGAKLVWESRPGGRGRVTEKVLERESPVRFVVSVFEDRLLGRQTVAFAPDGEGTAVAIELDYALTNDNLARKVVDVFFIRPRLRESLRRTLRRFATEAAEEAALPEP
jgi:uncharacterized protein YndB with AHSA1/START domain